ncbi:PilN domain-containing protein, partial [Alphaproteobacteria bacterium]|nr:PilN domain-containing protein [Alphaproteobacteria bacterium]
MGGWTVGVVVPGFLESQRESRGFDSIRLEATSSQDRITSIDEKIASLQTELANIETALARSGKFTIMNTLPDLVPEGMELSSYSLAEDNTISITGTAINQEVILLFVTELLNSGLIEGPDAGAPVAREGSGFFDFIVTGTLRQES